jgi:hypothetical protein
MKNFAISIVAIVTMSVVALTANAQNVQSVNKEKKTADVEYTDGSKKTFEKTRSTKMTTAQNLAVINGELKAYDSDNTGFDGKDLLKTTISVAAGAAYVEKTVIPQVTVGVGHSFWKNVDLEAQFEYSRGRYEAEAVAEGWYNNLGIYLGCNVTLAQDDNLRYASGKGLKWSIGAFLGYTYHETDDLSVEKINGSSGYSLTGKANTRVGYDFGGGLSLGLEIGVRSLPGFSLDNSKSGQEDFFGKIAPYGQLRLGVSF